MRNLLRPATVFCFCLSAFWSATLFAQETCSAKLIWQNGDRLPVVPLVADDQWLQVKSPLFRDPLDINFSVLDSIVFDRQKGDDDQPVGSFAIQMTDGQTVSGDIKRLDDSVLVVESDHAGEVSLDRSRIASVYNLKSTEMVASGGFDLSKWDAERDEKKYWNVDDRGALNSKRSNIHLFLKSELPESCLMEVEINWQRKLDFVMALEVPADPSKCDNVPRLESWDSSIVFCYEDDFEIVIEETDPSKKRLKLLLYWDRTSGKVVIRDERGKALMSTNIGKLKDKSVPGVYFANQSGDLTVSSLSIRKSSASFDATKPSIQIVGQSSMNAALKSFDGESWTAEDSQGKPIEFSAEDFSGAYLVNPAAKEATTGDFIKFTDGFSLIGRFISLKNDLAVFESNISSDPIELNLNRAAIVRFANRKAADPPNAGKHRMFNSAGSLQGTLESGSGEPGDVLRWRVVGGRQPVPFISSEETDGGARVVLRKSKPTSDFSEQWPDTLHLKNKDQVPCAVTRMDDTSIYVDSIFANKSIPQSMVKAVDFQRSGVGTGDIPLKADSSWAIADKKAIKFANQTMKLKNNAKAFHPWLLSRNGFEFELNWPPTKYGLLQLRRGSAADTIYDQGCMIMMQDRSISVAPIGAKSAPNATFARDEKPVRIKFEIINEKLNVFFNGVNAYQKKIKFSDEIGAGLELRLVNWVRGDVECEISKMNILDKDSAAFQVDAKRREYLLTIPRLKARNLPKQILCAANRDMVRGQLESMSKDYVMFRSNNVLNRYPRDLMTTMVWIDSQEIQRQLNAGGETNPEPATEARQQETLVNAPPASSARQSAQLLLHGGRRLTLALDKQTDKSLIGDSVALGRCEIPFDQIYEIRFGEFAVKAADVAYSDWVAKLAPKAKLEPAGAESDGSGGLTFGGSSPLIGTSPTASIDLLDGQTTSLDQMKGKVVVLDFWATWCGPCVRALPDVQAVCDGYSEDEVVLIAVNQAESEDQVNQFLESRGLKLTVGMDEGKLSEQFNVSAIPQTVVIDQNGVVQFVKVGGSSDIDVKLKAAIDELLAAQSDAAQSDAAQSDATAADGNSAMN